MYNYFKNISYPFTDSSLVAATNSSDNRKLLKAIFIDFKINLYNVPDSDLSATISSIRVTNNGPGQRTLRFSLSVFSSTGTWTYAFIIDNPSTEFERIYVSDAPENYAGGQTSTFVGTWVDLNTLVQAYICVDGGAIENAPSGNTILNTTGISLEPARISSFYKHRVDSIVCQNALPLIQQTVDARYAPPQDPVFGNVKLQQGNNCLISVQSAVNTVVISAQAGANDTQEEACGVWSEKVVDKDILCNEVIYTISGVEPDPQGDIKIRGDSPVTVNSLPLEDLPEQFQEKINNSQDEFSDIIRYIYVGLPSAGDSSVFDCPTV